MPYALLRTLAAEIVNNIHAIFASSWRNRVTAVTLLCHILMLFYISDNSDNISDNDSNVEWLSNRTPANYFSAYVYASHFILDVLVRRAI